MIDRVDPRRDEERRTPISPQMAWRVAVMSFVAFALS